LASLREKLKALEELQQIDIESHELRLALDALPARRAAVEARVLEARKAYDEQKLRLEGNERERRQIDALLQMERDKVKKWEGRLGEIKTPREYAALSREIDIAKKTNDSQTEQGKELLAAAGTIKAALEQKGEALADAEDAAQADVAALEAQEKAQQATLAALGARRAGAAALVDPGLLGKYENIKKRRAGVAVAPVVGSTCKGCHRNIPPQLSIVLQRADSVETCPNCNRIIYSADAVNPPAPPPPAAP
jgi:predicted  nucleic acid-binding Zn-ribbon protein